MQVGLPSIISPYRPPTPGNSLITLLGCINQVHMLRNAPRAIHRVPVHPLLDVRMGAYRVYHRRYSPYTSPIPADRKPLETCYYIAQGLEEIFTTSGGLLQVSSLAAFSARSLSPRTELQGFFECLE